MTTVPAVTLLCSLGRPRPADPVNPQPGNYEYRAYGFQDRVSAPCIIPLSALVELFCPASVAVLCTPEVEPNYELFVEELTEVAQSGRLTLPEVRKVPVATPRDAAAVNAITEAILGAIAHGESIHLDLTLGLRATSFLTFLVAQLLQQTRAARIARLTYLNLEAAGSSADPAAPVPILDLTDLLRLPRLMLAADALERRGDLRPLTEAIQDTGELTDDEQADADEIQRRLELLRLKQIGSPNGRQAMRRLIEAMERHAARVAALAPVAAGVRRALAPLDPGGEEKFAPDRLAILARWYAEHGQPVQAVLLMFEAIVFLGVERVLGAKYPLLDPNKPPRRNGAPAEMDRACQIGQVAARLRGAGRADLAEGFQGFWADVRNARNTLAHAQLGFDGNDPPALDSRSIQKWVARFETLCQELAGLSGGSQ